MKAQELKPCPFCGGEAAIEYEFHTFHGSEIRCQSCSSASGHYEDDKDSAKAIAAWNRRQPVARTPLSDALAEYDKLRDHVAEQTCCMDGGCLVKRPKGMHTNGGCKCSRDNIAAQRMMYAGQRLAEAVRGITQEKQG